MTKDAGIARYIAGSSYPTTIAAAFALFAAATGTGVPVTLAAYGAVLAGAALVALHEAVLPYRAQWRPGPAEVRADLLFMAAVQVALPYLLSITLAVALAAWLRAAGWVVDDIWPHRWPVAAQACLMLLLADLPRYWLHRAFHALPAMWRFHAVHHSPARLYWLNVGRFHPVDKAAQFLVDALPFALLAVGPDVLAVYFVFYAVNGFYQHSNCEVRFGPLNYVVSGPQLHRWHHSVSAAQSDTNFGNNLIVWDTLFGTRFLPQDRQVGRLGLEDARYPTGFWAQLATPFRARPGCPD